MKKGSCLLNVQDGELPSIPLHLKRHSRQGHLACAALDVTEPEPLSADSPLWDMDNLILTHHVAGRLLFAGNCQPHHPYCSQEHLDAWLNNAPMRNVTPACLILKKGAVYVLDRA